ncbi:WAP four-disulfide core domain protein 3-like [Nematolebias whitei]|uniref:WAP four-disulfide core domain protein 3-like n=1 Tax=Nematolebias whitei TaxID=451745 RepID=UPI00189B7469|nr:WAP four-disulfide core domain protein 3-like [Nematolebias whitei]
MRTLCSITAVLLIAACLFEPSAQQKPGNCPRGPLLPVDIPPMHLQCDTDDECPEDLKCCLLRCVPPIPPFHKCPIRRKGPCIEQCYEGKPCRYDKTCCFNGCGHQCMTPIPIPP